MMLLFIVVAATVGISAACSLLEATLMSTRVPTLEAAKSGPNGAAAERFIDMKRQISKPTAAILIMNTVANTAGATFAGSLAVEAFGDGALAVFSVAFTIAILFLAEIVPKTLGAMQWRSIWRFIVWPLSLLVRVLGPAVWVTEKTASALVGGRNIKPTTEAEIAAMIRLGATVGELSRTELELLTSVLRFDEMRVSEVMVPRNLVQTLSPDLHVDEALSVVSEQLHTRYPLCHELDDAVLLVHLKDLCDPKIDRQTPIGDLARPLTRVPATMPISALLRQMQRTKQHMALVISEFGSALGLVTMENLLEQIVGAVEDEFDDEDRPLEPQEGGARVLPGSIPLRVLSEIYESSLSGERVETLNGWILEQLKRLPRKGDVVYAPGLHLEVLDVQRDQAVSVRITPVEQEQEQEQAEAQGLAEAEAEAEGATPPTDVPSA